ncbi:3-keto-disaccharide hydrolase [Marinimicrobium sp. C2-29]|uniref:3-keto-disaccharide hydrolase n=1 Tax=Marinimicrobium sp. C2-29 TaxID=3139825 RepID=UPI0031389A54
MRQLLCLAVLASSLFSGHALADKTELSADANLWMNVTSFGEAHRIGSELHLLSTGNWFYLTKRRYRDFELTLEVKVPELDEYVNSGIMFRGQIAYEEDIESYYAYGYQAEVDPSDRRWSGGLYEQGTSRQWLFPLHPERSEPGEHFQHNHSPEWTSEKSEAFRGGEWNHYRIRAVGPELKIWVNEVLTTHVTDTRFSEGHIGIQHHGSKAFARDGSTANTVKFRAITIEEL